MYTHWWHNVQEYDYIELKVYKISVKPAANVVRHGFGVSETKEE
jgi:hypothetical protein